MKKRILAGFMAAVMCCGLFAGCKSSSDSGKKKEIMIYSVADDYRNENITKMLNEKFPELDITLNYIGTGSLSAKLAAEGKDTDIDIIVELEMTYLEKCKDSLATLDDIDYSPFVENLVPADKKYAPWLINSGSVIVNRKMLEEKGASVPTSYDDLLKPEYKGLITMPNPKSSGSGYIFLLNLANERGDDAAIEYFDKLAENISGQGFTTSGSGPIQALLQGEAAIGFCNTYYAVNEINKGAELEVIYFDEGAPYNIYPAAMIAGREKDEDIMEVFRYLVNEVSREDKKLYVPEKVFKEQESTLENFPKNIVYGDMTGIDDIETKERLLEKWNH